MAKLTFTEGAFDAALREGFQKLPVEEVSAGLKGDILKRIKDSDRAIRRRNFFMNIVYRVSQATFALSLVLMAIFLPNLIENDKVNVNPESAMVETSAEKYAVKTNDNYKVYSTTKPQYTYVNYVSYP